MSGKTMMAMWCGAVVMGLAYLLFLKDANESAAFIVGQVVLGLFGLWRELTVKEIN